MRLFNLLGLLFLSALPAIGAEPHNEVKPSPNTTTTSASLFSHVNQTAVDSIFSAYDQPGSPGCAVGVMVNEELIFSSGYGIANLDYNIPIRPDSRFMIASVSKQFAAAALLMLQQEQKINLDRDLRHYLPELPAFTPTVTARQLIHHTSGLRDIYHLLTLADIGLDNTTTNERAIELICQQSALNFPAGSAFLYSNTGYFLISMLIERITGLTLDEYSQLHFFKPLGMPSTHWHHDTGKIVPNRVISYRPMPYGPGRFYRDNMERVGARGLFTTIEDFHLWHLNYLDNRTNLNSFFETMTRPGRLSNRNVPYAAGLRLRSYKTLPTIGHSGSYMGFSTDYLFFPNKKFAVAVFCNKSNIPAASLARQVTDLFLAPVFDDIFREYEGLYTHKSANAAYYVKLEKSDLYLIHEETDFRQRLTWRSEDRFSAGTWTVTFHRNRASINRLTINGNQTSPISFWANN